MALRFPRFSKGLAQDPTTRRIWFGIATAHDFESHDDITEERLYQSIFASHFGQLAIIFLWTSGNLFHVAWQGNFESWVQDPLHVRPIAHAIWDPHFGQPAVEAFTRGGALGPVNIAYSGVYQWWYTIGLRSNEDLYTGALFLLFLSVISLIGGWLHLQPKWKPSVSWFKNAESRLNHHLSGLFGVSSLAWTGHLVHVAIPGSRGEYVRWNNFLDALPHPQGLGPLFTSTLSEVGTRGSASLGKEESSPTAADSGRTLEETKSSSMARTANGFFGTVASQMTKSAWVEAFGLPFFFPMVVRVQSVAAKTNEERQSE